MKIHAAVIEWPSRYGEAPVLVAAATRAKMLDRTKAEIASILDAVDASEMAAFREAFEAYPDDFIEHIMDGDGGHPYVAFYEQEVSE